MVFGERKKMVCCCCWNANGRRSEGSHGLPATEERCDRGRGRGGRGRGRPNLDIRAEEGLWREGIRDDGYQRRCCWC